MGTQKRQYTISQYILQRFLFKANLCNTFIEFFFAFQYFYFDSEKIEWDGLVFERRDADGVLFRRDKDFRAVLAGVCVEILQFFVLEAVVVNEML